MLLVILFQVEDVQAELEKLRDENMQLQQDKLVSERAKVPLSS